MSSKIERGTIAEIDVVEGNLLVGEGATLKAKSGNKIFVNGRVDFEGDADILSSLEAKELWGEDCRIKISGDLTVTESIHLEDGDLIIEGQLVAGDVDVDRRVRVKDSLKCKVLSVGGSLEVGGDIEAVELSVGGSISVRNNIKGDALKVGGSVDVKGVAELERLEVGGRAKVGGGKINNIDVGGTFESTGKLKFGRIDVGGTVRLSACEGEGKVSVGGLLRVDGNFIFDEVSVGGTLEVFGSAEGNSVEVGGTVKVSGDAFFKRSLNVGGFARVGKELRAGNVSVGGSLEAEICFAEKVRVGGRVETQRGTKSKLFEIGRHGKVTGPVVAEQVEVHDHAELEDIYADLLVMGKHSSAHNVYVKRAVLNSGCKISGELVYTQELELGERLGLSYEPKKVEKLPEPPI